MNLLNRPRMQIPLKGFRAEYCAYPGCYTITYYDLKAGDVVCAKCATFERFRTALTPDVHWEGPPETCAVCNKELPSEYGDPEELSP